MRTYSSKKKKKEGLRGINVGASTRSRGGSPRSRCLLCCCLAGLRCALSQTRTSNRSSPAAACSSNMTNFQALLAVLGSLASPAVAFLPVPTTWSRHEAVTAAVAPNEAPISATARRGGGGGRGRQQLVMKKETTPGGGVGGRKARAKGEADDAADPRRQALDGVLHQIERCYGRGSILKMGDTTAMDIETSSTGRWERCTGL